MRDEPSRDTLAAVMLRDADQCVRCGNRAVHTHHRKLRSQAGPEEKHLASNLIRVCNDCHEFIHAKRPVSEVFGWIVPSWSDPAEVPIKYHDGYRINDADGNTNYYIPE